MNEDASNREQERESKLNNRILIFLPHSMQIQQRVRERIKLRTDFFV